MFTLKVKDIIKNNKVTVSFEVFPPKEWDKVESTKAVINELAKLSPSFMSVTYGAAGTTSGFTTEIANSVKENGITPLAHLTCLTSTRDKIHTVVNELKENGMKTSLRFAEIYRRILFFPINSIIHMQVSLLRRYTLSVISVSVVLVTLKFILKAKTGLLTLLT